MPITKLREVFADMDNCPSKITPLGGVSFIFRFQKIEDMRLFLENEPDVIDYLFRVFRVWQDGDCAYDRLCWTLFKGIPPHVWTWEFFQFVSKRVGVMIDWSLETKSMERLDVAEILILMPSKKFIDTVVNVTIGGIDCEIGIAESQYDPLDWDWSSFQPVNGDRVVDSTPAASDQVTPSTFNPIQIFQQSTMPPL
ncbi:hypothetical protein Tsubulata_024289 [Turnera subulata]|uniref:DUF4283 domain-containing protein n=1 Tax=Turnera subulata TaxID=218843 RepID=A0A9Q0F6W9_9ROSI|nr:hypothetical protein Tsubulata_024289 [Turnera subulata]